MKIRMVDGPMKGHTQEVFLSEVKPWIVIDNHIYMGSGFDGFTYLYEYDGELDE